MKRLNEILDAGLKTKGATVYTEKVPAYLYSNLKAGFGQRLYQQEAFGRFIYYLEEYPGKPVDQPVHLLFHMATGSGKTVIMAGLMIYLYNRGYRNFLFFVNSSTIIEKTKNNFTNTHSSKYLFAETIAIGEKRINIRVSENFEASQEKDITIVFTTIQGLHARLNTPRENAVTYEDFIDKKIVLISDEAHHINAETKKGAVLHKEERESLISWEATVNKLFKANKRNLLLEFTATIDLSLPEIEKKYADKLLFDYPLRQFRKDGYSKEVKILQADLPLFERALQALLLSQYRIKVFEKERLRIKPVILFKSKTIRESQVFYAAFIQQVKQLDAHQIQSLKNKLLSAAGAPSGMTGDRNGSVLLKALSFFDKNKIHFENLALELKQAFSTEKCLIVNSKEESEHKQLAINTLEEEGNEYRAVFAVDKLNEGWDVLNLFDIVRLYDTRDATGGKPGKTTVSEAQLIGRGARYCPFEVAEGEPADRRKFDDDVENELRVCEELYYHSAYNLRYIQELNTALTEIGIKPELSKECNIKVKDSFKTQSFYRESFVFLNERVKYRAANRSGLDSAVIQQRYKVRLQTGIMQSSAAFNPQSVPTEPEMINRVQNVFCLLDFGVHVIRKALARLPFYQFSNLRKLLPGLSSISELITSERYLGTIAIELSGLKEQMENLTQQDKLQAAIQVLEKMAPAIEGTCTYKGTKEFTPFLLKDLLKDKTIHIPVGESGEKDLGNAMRDPLETPLYLNLQEKEWYALGNCFGDVAEKKLILCIDEMYSRLRIHFDEVCLIKNERFFRIYRFDDGCTLYPAFLLLLIKKDVVEEQHHQVFIEISEYSLQQKREKSFLQRLTDEHIVTQQERGKKHFIWGLSFDPDKAGEVLFNNILELLIENDGVLKP